LAKEDAGMEVKAQFRNRIGVLALFALVGAAGAAVLYYGMYFVLALVNYFDSFYKHETFYQLYPTAASYLATFFSTGTLKHLPGYEIEINLGIPLLFGCGMVCLGLLLAMLLHRNELSLARDQICGKALFGKPFAGRVSDMQQVKLGLLWGLLLQLDGKWRLFLFMKNRREILEAFEAVKTE
jgi:hypothetical protein